ncbi:MAG: tetratricopeptide repeat protein [Capsulimonadaceae bacterium]
MSKRKKHPNNRKTFVTASRRSILTEEQIILIRDLVEKEAWEEVHATLLPLAEQAQGDSLVLEILLDSAYHVEDERTLERAAVRLTRLQPHDAIIMLRLAIAYELNDRPALALRTFERLVREHPDRADEFVRSQIGELRTVVDEFLADEGFTGPGGLDIVADHEESQSLIALGEYAQARRVAESVIKRAPTYIPTRNNLAVTYRAEGNYAATIAAFLQVLELAPDNVHALANLVECYCRAGERANAIAMAARLKASTAWCWNRRWKITEALTYIGDDDGVLDLYGSEPDDDEDDLARAKITHYAAVARYRRNEKTEAERLWREALEFDEDFELPIDNITDLALVPGKRHGPAALGIADLMRPRIVQEIRRVLTASGGSDEARQRDCRRLIRQNPEIVSLSGLILDLCDRMSAEVVLMLGLMSGDPGILAALRRFSAGDRGSDSIRYRALAIVRYFDPDAFEDVLEFYTGDKSVAQSGNARSRRASLILRTARRLSGRAFGPRRTLSGRSVVRAHGSNSAAPSPLAGRAGEGSNSEKGE